jgi:hypothetical protein
VAEQMGVTGTRSSRRRQVLLLVVGVTKCVDDDDADAGFNKMFFGWLLCHALGEFLQTTSDHAFKNYSNE